MTEAPCDTITVLTSRDIITTKAYRELGGKLVKEDTGNAYLFDCTSLPVGSLSDLAEVLQEAEQNRQKAIIRGQLKEGREPANLRRKKVNFDPEPRRWCMIDIDDWPLPPEFNDYQKHKQDIVEHVIEGLPAEFHSIDCWYQFSSSMGVEDGKISLHLCYWLSRKVADHEMKAWLDGHGVDLHLYHQVQMHFIAKPVFLNGAQDPIPDRSGFHRSGQGLEEVHVPEDLEQRAMQLRPDAWERIVESGDEEAAASINMMLALYGIAEGQSDLPAKSIEALTHEAPDLIPNLVLALNDWTKSTQPTEPFLSWAAGNQPEEPVRRTKIGRNEPCPCGSGRKYKRCCGAN